MVAGGFRFPLDAYVLAVPIAYACTAFLTMTFRVPTSDPETSRVAFYDDESQAAQVAQRHDNTFKSYFQARIRDHKVGVFQNWLPGSPQ